ncbi:hypothetical protein CVT26_007701 [Gymnopilus dilepis]|uniref:Uncharacterized protein n=1 Tax=Gymnopilus dilepis TaxID=231916 RepID=A0A409WIL7_9AGAR|nr:hypothetical protein CVT26_007701 [Gymnopilus dilepis]
MTGSAFLSPQQNDQNSHLYTCRNWRHAPHLYPQGTRAIVRFTYGFHLDEKRMTAFAAANFPKVVPKGFPMILVWFAQRLRFEAQYAHLRVKGAVADGVDVPPEAEVMVESNGVPLFVVFTVTSWERRAWDARPTVEQVEILKEITGVEPGWYIDQSSNTPVTWPPKLETHPPPLLSKYKGHRQVYGFHVDERKMIEFATANFPEAVRKGFWIILMCFTQHLRFEAQYAHVRLTGALADDVHVPPGAQVMVGPTGVRQFPVIVVTSWERRAWSVRPTLEQLDIMKEIAGVEPDWYIDVDTYGVVSAE